MIDIVDGSNLWKVGQGPAGPVAANPNLFRQIHFRAARHHVGSTEGPGCKWMEIGAMLVLATGVGIFLC